MPYIKQERRLAMLREAQAAFPPTMGVPGELNYEITLKILEYMTQHGLSYQTINDVIGALEGAKLEFYRRIAVPYEDRKIAENGDVY